MKHTLVTLFLTFLGLPFVADARALMVATAPTTETLTLTDEKWECPSSKPGADPAWDARKVVYHDPRDGETENGCYVIDARDSPHTVIIIFRQGSLSGGPIYLPTRIFKPEI